MCITIFIILFISKKENDLLVKNLILHMDNFSFIHKFKIWKNFSLKVILMLSTVYPQQKIKNVSMYVENFFTGDEIKTV